MARENRKLCGIFKHIERDGRMQDVCLTDMTVLERSRIIAKANHAELRGIIRRLFDVAREILSNWTIAFGSVDIHFPQNTADEMDAEELREWVEIMIVQIRLVADELELCRTY